MLRIATLSFKLKFQKDGHLYPWLGSVFRSAFGAVLRSLSCGLKDGTCSSCILAASCAYGYLFDSPVPSDLATEQGSHKPHPFVFKPPLLESVETGQSIDLGLTLVGKALDYLPYIVLSVRELGRRGLGRHQVRFNVLDLVCTRTGHEIDLDRPSTSGIAFDLPLPSNPCKSGNSQSFKILFKTPLRLKFRNQRMFRFGFRPFVFAAIRRVELLTLWHCGHDVFGGYNHLLAESENAKLLSDRTYFHDWMRFSRTQGQRIPVGGILGQVELEGDYKVFSELFEAARFLGVGNQTSFGLGQVDFRQIT
jgi:CRISPR/Cas system endoribonuclease Cas6 (RAMP superfamily)